ncbi:MAG TPA: hypothetical protein VHD83_24845 [Puia sp.]|nr:hypothetical protein [Puia sp.]
MSSLRQTFCLSLLLCFLFPAGIRAQFSQNDSLIESTAYNNAVSLYHAYLKPEPGLFRGKRYREYSYQLAEGHPFFGDGKMHKGSVLYDSVLYQDLMLWYDMVKDQLVMTSPYGAYKIYLIGNQVDSFTIGDHIFIHQKDSLNPSAPRRGFYEQLYKGQISVLKKNKKVIHEDLQLSGVRQFIDSSLSYYIKKGDTYYSIGNKRSLSHALKDRSKDLNKFLRQNKLKVRKDLENTLIKVAAWYDGLNH